LQPSKQIFCDSLGTEEIYQFKSDSEENLRQQMPVGDQVPDDKIYINTQKKRLRSRSHHQMEEIGQKVIVHFIFTVLFNMHQSIYLSNHIPPNYIFGSNLCPKKMYLASPWLYAPEEEEEEDLFCDCTLLSNSITKFNASIKTMVSWQSSSKAIKRKTLILVMKDKWKRREMRFKKIHKIWKKL
jgi:hypothetical protein